MLHLGKLLHQFRVFAILRNRGQHEFVAFGPGILQHEPDLLALANPDQSGLKTHVLLVTVVVHQHADGPCRLRRIAGPIGVGAEYAFWQNVSAKIEFDHFDFGSKDIRTSDAAGDFVIFNISQRLNIIKAGINYKF